MNPGDNKVVSESPEVPLPANQTLPYEYSEYDTLLIDMSHLLNRVLRVGGKGESGEPPYIDLKTSAGVPTGGVYGVLKSIRGLLGRQDFKFRDVVAIWDGRPRGRSPRRTALYADYKQPKPDEIPDPEDLKFRALYEDQRPKIDDFLAKLGIPVINLPYREGDDVLANIALCTNGRTLTLSDDKDFYQLVRPNLHIYRPVKDVVVTPANFVEITGVQYPFQYLIVAAICGDGSDNISGIDGVGGTTALKVANAVDVSQVQSSKIFPRESLALAIQNLTLKDSRNRRYYKILNENLASVERNFYLVNLLLEDLTPEEWSAASAAYHQARGFDEMEVARAMANYEFKSYLDRFAYWIMPFRTLYQARWNRP